MLLMSPENEFWFKECFIWYVNIDKKTHILVFEIMHVEMLSFLE